MLKRPSNHGSPLHRRLPKAPKFPKGYENLKSESDFLYGLIVGMIQGDVYKQFRDTHLGRRLNEDESMEIKEIIESHAKEIRDIFYKE
ncbi:MAG: hypothetical protein ACREA3_07610 [Nitrosotalea sp.]